jgi:6-aminohexanoate-oligomer endohydrolase
MHKATPMTVKTQKRQETLKNENGLVPVSGGQGRQLKFDFPGIRIGIAEYQEGPTGCTVLHFPARALCQVDVRGGAPGLFGGYGYADAICFAGGSLYGLESATGVAAEILKGRQDASWGNIACVSGAIIYDFGARRSLCYPDKTLGRAAFRAAVEGYFPLGRQGAGRSATVGKISGSRRFEGEPGGQGAAVDAIGSLTVGVFTVVNSIGAVVDDDGSVLRGYKDRKTGKRLHLSEIIARFPEEIPSTDGLETGGNTTVSAIVVNQRLEPYELRQLARQVHAAMARVIQPFHTIRDGDIMFAVSAGEEPPSLNVVAIGEFASSLAVEAVRAAVAD